MLFKAIQDNRLDLCEGLLKKDRLLIFDLDDGKRTPLVAASMAGRLDIVRLILEYSPAVDHKDGEEKTALCHAMEGCFLEIVKGLLVAGADPWSHNRRHPLSSSNPDINFLVKNARMVDILLAMTKPGERQTRWESLKDKIVSGNILAK